jgi:phosphoglycolate phosphatase-like HAD superfamily hydrolase
MHLLIFDIDGTLCDTNYIDELCLVQSAQQVLNIQNISSDWSTYKQSTDSGIILELIETTNLHSENDMYSTVKKSFLELLEKYYYSNPEYFFPIPGAKNIIPLLIKEGFAIGIATGCWLDSAMFKLEKVGIQINNIPICSADNDIERVNIIKQCIKDCSLYYHKDTFSAITYIGDGSWDLLAAKNLGIDFLGIAKGNRAIMLKELGAQHVFEEYSLLHEYLIQSI